MRCLFIIPFVCTLIQATILHVPEEYPDIQSGINFSTDGDTVLVQPGTYFENILIQSRQITLATLYVTTGDTNYISTTIIDGSHQSPTVTIENCSEVVPLSGFTVTHGSAVWRGGGIECIDSNIHLDHMVVVDNFAGEACSWDGSGSGGGIAALHSTVEISNCIISENHTCGGWGSGGSGGGIYLDESVAVLDGIAVTGNESGSGGGIRLHESAVTVNHCIIANNEAISGGGISTSLSELDIVQSTIATNAVDDQSSFGIFGVTSEIDVLNSILWGDGPQSVVLYSSEQYPFSTFTSCYSVIRGGEAGIQGEGEDIIIWGEGNLDLDPLFQDPGSGEYHLDPDSPCIDAGNPDLDGDGFTWEDDPDDQDPDGTRMDMGAFYFDQFECEYSADFDGDGSFDLGDLFQMLDLILELSGPPTEEEICIGDGDGDGWVTVIDFPPDADECDGFAPYIPDLPAIELSLPDHSVLASDSLFTLEVYMNHPQSIHAIQFDLVFPDVFLPFAVTTNAGEFGFILNPGNLDDRVRIVILDLWDWPPDSPASMLCEITFENPGISGDYEIFIDRGFAPGECNQPYDVVGSTSELRILDSPQAFMLLGNHDQEAKTIDVWIESSEELTSIQTQITGLHLVEGTEIVEDMAQFGWILNWNDTGLLLSFGFVNADPGLYQLATLQYDYLTADSICITDTHIYSGMQSLLVANGPCITVDYCSLPGDVNGDEVIDILDVVLVVECILEYGLCDCADTNEDENVDIIDIVQLIFSILEG